MSEVETCAICQEVIDISKSVLTSCNHRFHSECFFKWLKKKPNCPMCRTVFREPNNYEIEQEREIHLKQEEMNKRFGLLTLPEPRYKSGVLHKYSKLVSGSDAGAVTN